MNNPVVAFDARMHDYPGGIARYVRSLITEFVRLDDLDVDIRLIGSSGSLQRYAHHSRFAVEPDETPLFSIQEHVGVPIKARQSDLLHVPNFNAPLLYRKRLVVTIHDLTHLKLADMTLRKPIYGRLFRWMMKSGTNRADRIIVVSNNTKRDVQHLLGVSEAKIDVIYPGVSDQFRELHDPDLIERTKRHYGIEGAYILSLGNIKPHKNLQRLIQAFESIYAQNDHKLVIAGKGKGLEQVLQANIQSSKLRDRVTITGYVDEGDLPALYNGASLFVYPSLYEGFGIPPLEAMACGTPVLTSNTSSLPEVVGDAAVTVDPYDVEEIAEGIESILGDSELRERLIMRGLQRVCDFSWNTCAEQTLETYRRVLND